jgi:hypothetical protein
MAWNIPRHSSGWARLQVGPNKARRKKPRPRPYPALPSGLKFWPSLAHHMKYPLGLGSLSGPLPYLMHFSSLNSAESDQGQKFWARSGLAELPMARYDVKYLFYIVHHSKSPTILLPYCVSFSTLCVVEYLLASSNPQVLMKRHMEVHYNNMENDGRFSNAYSAAF